MIVRKWESLNIYTWNMKSHKALTGIDLCKNRFIRLSDIAMYPGTLRSDREPNKCKGKMEDWKAFLQLSSAQKVKHYSHLIKINGHIYGGKIKTLAKNIWKLLQKYYIQRDFANLSPAMALCWNSGST